jgi:hypothetical protein
MPSEVRENVIGLLVQMLCDHYHRVHGTAKIGEAEDE